MALREESNFAGMNFIMFYGVVEDRMDPLNVGRVRVRCYGWHSSDKTLLPTESLPWAQILMPPTSAGTSGIGSSPTGLVEGSVVVGYFLDGKLAKQPIIMGSLVGIPSSGSGRGETGFSDPDAKYPVNVEKPDTPLLAFDEWMNDLISQVKRDTRVKDVPTAKAPALKEVSQSAEIPSESWNEPEQRGGDSVYPFNHVTQTESGHAIEIDDTIGSERLHVYHRTGTFVEVQPDGKRITKIVGDDYEIVAMDKNVFIKGECNVTIAGDCRMLIQGNKIEEIIGDHRVTVHGSRLTKINGSEFIEISGERSVAITGKETRLVGKDLLDTIAGQINLICAKNRTEVIMGEHTSSIKGDWTFLIGNKSSIASGGPLDIISASQASIKASHLAIRNNQTITGTSTATVDHISAGKSGATHTHTDSVGLGAGITSGPN